MTALEPLSDRSSVQFEKVWFHLSVTSMLKTKSPYWLFVLPSLIMLGLVMVYPLCYAIYISFFNYDLSSGARKFIGLANYGLLLGEVRFWEALGRTLLIAGLSVTIEFWLGVFLAFGLYKLTTGAKLFNLLLFLPSVITPVVAGLFLKWVLAARWGLVSALMIAIGIFPPDFLGSAGWARFAVIMGDVWQYCPFVTLVMYAGLNAIDQGQIDAAEIDGASNWQILFWVMLPSLRPLIVFVLAIRIMDAFRSFDLIYVLTAGGPGTATETLALYTYNIAFRQLEMGKAASLGFLTLAILVAITVTMMRLVYRREPREPK